MVIDVTPQRYIMQVEHRTGSKATSVESKKVNQKCHYPLSLQEFL